MKSYGSIGQNLANLGRGLGSDASSAYNLGGTALMNAQQSTGMAQAQLPYALGQHLMGYANQEDPYKNVAAQYNNGNPHR